MQIHVNLYENQHIPSVSWQVILCLRCSDCVRLSGRLKVSDTINAPVRYGEGRRCWDRSWRVTGAVSLLPFAHSPLNSVSSPWERQARGVENRRGATRTLECLVITALPAAIPPPREQECSPRPVPKCPSEVFGPFHPRFSSISDCVSGFSSSGCRYHSSHPHQEM